MTFYADQTIHLRRWQNYAIFDPYPPQISIKFEPSPLQIADVLNGLSHKAELPLEGIFFPLNFLPWEFLLIKKFEINKTKTT